MCYRLFIASDRVLPVVAPTVPVPSFAVEPVAADDLLRQLFPPGWQVAEAGSTSGCACDFQHHGGASRLALIRYLTPLRGRQAIRLYSTWYGDEADAYRELPPLSVEGLGQDDDPIPQQTMISII